MPIEVKMSTKSETHGQRPPIDARGLIRIFVRLMLMLIRMFFKLMLMLMMMLMLMLIRLIMMLMLTSPVLGQELNKEQPELLRVT